VNHDAAYGDVVAFAGGGKNRIKRRLYERPRLTVRAHAVDLQVTAVRDASPLRACRFEQGGRLATPWRVQRSAIACRQEVRDRTFEQQRLRASGLSLTTTDIVPWQPLCPERAA
jgi:hypothetical protein